MDKKFETVFGKVYQRKSGSNVLKYVCEEHEFTEDFGSKWNEWADSVGARRATADDMLSIGDDAIVGGDVGVEGDVTPMDGGGEYIEDVDILPIDGGSFDVEEDEIEHSTGLAMIEEEGGLIDESKEEWIAMNTPLGGEPVDMDAAYEAAHTPLG